MCEDRVVQSATGRIRELRSFFARGAKSRLLVGSRKASGFLSPVFGLTEIVNILR
jgi:hypothetical protein